LRILSTYSTAGDIGTIAPVRSNTGMISSGDRLAKKNLQVLLRTKIVDETPRPPSIADAYFW
jgi:hypothetical protein